MPTLAQISLEIQNDPASLGYASIAGQYNALTDLLNNTTIGTPMPQAMPMLEFTKWAAGNGTRQKLKDGQNNATFGAICDTAIDMFAELTITFDPSDTATQQMMTALVSAGILDQTTDVDAAVTFCTQPASRAENLWGEGTLITLDEVTTALNGF
jgi:hypothetical protein